MNNSKNAIIRGRVCYSSLDRPNVIGQEGTGEPRYRLTLLIDKADKDAQQDLLAIAKEAYTEKFGPDALKSKPDGWSGINDGDKRSKGSDGIHDGCYYINCKSKNKPVLVDEYKEITTKIYDGCYVNVAVFAYGYEHAGKRGIAYAFSGVQFDADGEKIEHANHVLDSFKSKEHKIVSGESEEDDTGVEQPFSGEFDNL